MCVRGGGEQTVDSAFLGVVRVLAYLWFHPHNAKYEGAPQQGQAGAPLSAAGPEGPMPFFPLIFPSPTSTVSPSLVGDCQPSSLRLANPMLQPSPPEALQDLPPAEGRCHCQFLC